MIVEAFNIRFFQRTNPGLSESRSDKSIVHIFIVLQGVVLDASFDLEPQIKKIIDGYRFSLNFDAVCFVLLNLYFFFTQFYEGLCVNVMPFPV